MAQVTRKAKMAGINLIVFGRIINARVRQQSDEIGLVRKMKSYAESEVEVKIFDIYANKEIFSEKVLESKNKVCIFATRFKGNNKTVVLKKY